MSNFPGYVNDEDDILEEPSYDPVASQEFVNSVSTGSYDDGVRNNNHAMQHPPYGRASMPGSPVAASNNKFIPHQSRISMPASPPEMAQATTSPRIRRSPRSSRPRISRISTGENEVPDVGGYSTTEPQQNYSNQQNRVSFSAYDNNATSSIPPPRLHQHESQPAVGVGIYEGPDGSGSGGGGGPYSAEANREQQHYSSAAAAAAAAPSSSDLHNSVPTLTSTEESPYNGYGTAAAAAASTQKDSDRGGRLQQYNSMASINQRPFPKAAIPVEPKTPGMEPSSTNLSRLSKRAGPKRRPVDIEVGALQLNTTTGQPGSSCRIQCVTCATLLYISKSTSLVQCPTCDSIHIVASCPMYMEEGR